MARTYQQCHRDLPESPLDKALLCSCRAALCLTLLKGNKIPVEQHSNDILMGSKKNKKKGEGEEEEEEEEEDEEMCASWCEELTEATALAHSERCGLALHEVSVKQSHEARGCSSEPQPGLTCTAAPLPGVTFLPLSRRAASVGSRYSISTR
ncbi:unnamed protein product [Boreogadus saida]